MRFVWMGCYSSMSEFKYLGYVLDELGTDGAEYHRKIGRWSVEGEFQVLLGLWLMLGVTSLSVLGVLHESLLMTVW